MKKNRLTRITIITREIISLSKRTSGEIHDLTIPVGPVSTPATLLAAGNTINIVDGDNGSEDVNIGTVRKTN